MNKKELQDFLREYYYPLKDLNRRLHEETPSSRARNEYQRDYSRILYSTSFRRLQGKMQLLGIKSDKFYRNRLTHSLEVAQIARAIAERLRVISELEDVYVEDTYVVEAGALAHDIGNPPFGHHGERILNKLMSSEGGFEGNAQTLRVLNTLEKKLPRQKGLNLSLRTLFSVVKYFKPYDGKSKKFIYESTYEQLLSEIEGFELGPRTLDVQIVDLADEIAYAAHDLEDALSLKLFNIDEFVFEFKHTVNTETEEKLEELVRNAKNVARSASNYNSSEEFGFLLRKELTSNLVNELVNDIGIVEITDEDADYYGTSNKLELGFETLKEFAKSLKTFTFKCINRTNIVQMYEKQGEKIIKGLFDAFQDESFNDGNILLPIEYRHESESKNRLITDYISGMMDSFSFQVYKQLYGENSIDTIYDVKYFREYQEN
ncbi:deoxyguanosinetriphosphate triphosphohydrolase family protein [Salinibacillus xinjiangensis]|uniref:DNTP triphosphohydrolase n=1 Tax=Salinibacillus xinjiangensis TaxID=1229268 RepID=A0A6G1XAU5_9BACI|nr:dNTP triphosphohydrolase [Salinibacillus xinjiangensis]MRG88133.1 dNTP triphosphohydrolase [Salinibacillus xinjiangensis]